MPLSSFDYQRFLKIQQYREAIASVSLSHRDDCVCMICLAAKGDEDMMNELIANLERSDDKKVVPQRQDVGDEGGSTEG